MTRRELLAGVAGLATARSAPPPRHSTPVSRTQIGAIRWDAWTRWASETGWGGYEKSLGPKEWRDRLPFYARAVSDDRVEICGDSPEILAREIDYAAGGGIVTVQTRCKIR